MLRACSLILCLCFALAAPATAFADASARVLSVTPGVRYSLGGAGEALAVKMDVPIKAVVMSDATGKAQLMFPDDSTLSIAPDTQISLAEYVDAEHEENIVLDLVSGTARIITGESNRKNPQAFTVNTPQASIGIRGTLVTIQAGGDVTRVYLTETSGKGVSVRNLGTGQVIELRKPGTIINVGANFMEERKAQKEEAANFSAALRGKSRAELERATARAQGEIHRAAAARLKPEGALPPAGAADPVQLAALTAADRLDHANLVPDVPEAPSVPVLPVGPVLPEPDVNNYLITDYSQILGSDCSFLRVVGNCDYFINNEFLMSGTADVFMWLEHYFDVSFDNNIFTINANNLMFPYPTGQGKKIKTYYALNNVVMRLNMDGNFSVEYKDDTLKNSATLQGKFTSHETCTITNFAALIEDKYGTKLKDPTNVTFEKFDLQ